MKRLNEKIDYNVNAIKSQKLEPNNNRLDASFYNVSCNELAVSLLGKIIARKVDSLTLRGRIVETECYPGGIDKASHSFNGRYSHFY